MTGKNRWDPLEVLDLDLDDCNCHGTNDRGTRCGRRLARHEVIARNNLIAAIARMKPRDRDLREQKLWSLATSCLCRTYHRTSGAAALYDDFLECLEETHPLRRPARLAPEPARPAPKPVSLLPEPAIPVPELARYTPEYVHIAREHVRLANEYTRLASEYARLALEHARLAPEYTRPASEARPGSEHEPEPMEDPVREPEEELEPCSGVSIPTMAADPELESALGNDIPKRWCTMM